jgi:hypothetical protein
MGSLRVQEGWRNFSQSRRNFGLSGGSTGVATGYSNGALAIRVDMPHRVDIIDMSGKIGNPPSLACLDTNRFLGWLAATSSSDCSRSTPAPTGRAASVHQANCLTPQVLQPAVLSERHEPRRIVPDRQEAEIRDDIGPGHFRDSFPPPGLHSCDWLRARKGWSNA